MSLINETNDRLYRNLSDSEKMSQTYALPSELSSKIQTYLIDNQIVSKRFNVE